MKKICSRCKRQKYLGEFHKKSCTKDGHTAQCKSCVKLSKLNPAVEARKKRVANLAANGLKGCSSCKSELALSEFSSKKSNRDGRMSMCKSCESMIKHIRYLANKDEIKAKRREYVAANKEEVYAKDRKYKKTSNIAKEYKRNHYKNNRAKILKQKSEYHLKNRDSINANKKLYNSVHRQSLCRNNFHANKLPNIDDAKFVMGTLTVRCRNSECRKRFSPSNEAVASRYKIYKGLRGGENNFYCCETHKRSCKLFGFRHFQVDPDSILAKFEPNKRELQGPWALSVKERDGYECQRCGSKEELHAHHILPLAAEYDAWHISNGITFCSSCHYRYAHQLPGCTVLELRDACR